MARAQGALTLSEADRRILAVWAADCAERSLAIFELRAPHDSRPRDAIVGARAFARISEVVYATIVAAVAPAAVAFAAGSARAAPRLARTWSTQVPPSTACRPS